MTPAELLAALSTAKRPFRPFTLRLVDGRTFAVDTPDCWCISPRGSYIVVHAKVYHQITADQIAGIDKRD